MSVKLPEHMRGAYDVLCRYMEKLPEGSTWDILTTKVPTLRRLKSKEQDLMLEYVAERNRLHVVPTARKGEKSAPLIIHTMFGVPKRIIEETSPTPKDTVYVASPGKPELQKAQPVKETPIETPQQDPTPVTEPAPVEKQSDTPDAVDLRNTYLPPNLHVAAADIMAYLVNKPNGVARTELGNGVLSYHRLRGANRQVVLSYLVAYEGVREVQPTVGGARAAAVFMHPNFTQDLDKSEKPYDHSAPELPLDTFKPLVEPTLNDAPAPVVPATPAVAEPSEVISLADIGQEIIDALYSVDGERMTMRALHDLVPRYHNLDDNERRLCVNALVREDKVRTYRVPNDYNGVMWIKIYSQEEQERDRVVRQTPPVVENAMMAAFRNAQEKAPMPELKPTPADDTATPVTPAAAPTPVPVAAATNSADLFAQIAQLTSLATQLQNQEQNAQLRETLRPLHATIVTEYNNVQTALSLQIDAVAALGLAVEQFTQAMGDK